MEEAIAPTARAGPRRTAFALGAVGLGAVALVAGAWVLRVPAANAVLQSALEEREVRGAWRIAALDLSGARLDSVKIGPADTPDFAARTITLRFGWGFGPRLAGVEIEGGRLNARLTDKGLDLGDLGKLVTGGPPSTARKPLPNLEVRTSGFVATLDTPAGAVRATLDASGRLREDFRADVKVLDSTADAADGRIRGLDAHARLRSDASGLVATLAARADDIVWPGGAVSGLALTGDGRGDAALDALSGVVKLDAATAKAGSFGGQTLALSAKFDAKPIDRSADRDWRVETTLAAAALDAPALSARDATAGLTLARAASGATGAWTLASRELDAAGARGAATAKGDLRLAAGGALSGAGTVSLSKVRAPTSWSDTLNLLGPTPAAPLVAATRPTLRGALDDFALDAPIAFAWNQGAGAVRATDRLIVRAATGASLVLDPPADAPPLQVTLPSGRVELAGTMLLEGGGLPKTDLRRFALSVDKSVVNLAGRLTIADWSARGARLAVDDLDLAYQGNPSDRRLAVAGDITTTGPFAGATFVNARIPLDLTGVGDAESFAIKPTRGCLPIAAETVALPSFDLTRAAFSICPPREGAFAILRADGGIGGGFAVQPAALTGRTRGAERQAVTLAFGGLDGRLGGTTKATTIALTARDVRYAQTLEPSRVIAATAKTVDADVRTGGGTWLITGRFGGGGITDPTLTANVTDVAGALRVEPKGERALVTISDAVARITDSEDKPRFQPLRVADARAVIDGDALTATGDLRSEITGARLAGFTAEHDLSRTAGRARVTATDLTFNDDLQPFQLTELARGVVENVEGPIDAQANAVWDGPTLKVSGDVTLKNLAAATAGLGPVSGVSGKIAFDDLFLLTTPPGQELRLGEINPGVKVRDGVVRFQMQKDGLVALESARFPFAAGVLSVSPTFVRLGADETRYTLELKDVDVATLIRDLDFKDLSATGRVEGVFPLVVTPRGARIENGRLQAAPGGGEIAYTGQAAEATAGGGPSQVAFDALKSFRYDNLALELNGDVDGEIITGIKFEGVNNAPLSAATIVPGMRTFGATGLPFRFNVTVRAPFRALADRASRFSNPLKLIDDARGPQGVDPSKVP